MKRSIKIGLILLFATFSCLFFPFNNNPNEVYASSSSYSTLPSSFNLTDVIDIKVENQNPYGTCYAYASLTSLETYLALNYNEYYDFSELHFALSLYIQDGYYNSVLEALNDGGNFTHFFTYTQKNNSLVLEQDLSIANYSNTSSGRNKMVEDYISLNNNFTPIAKVNDVISFPKYVGNKSLYPANELTSFRNSVKEHIMTYGSLTAGINSNTLSQNTINYRVTDENLLGDGSTSAINRSINHLISIVGWDDNYDANGEWENKGAYICLNSWGERFGDNGYFYVSYDDYFIEYSIEGVKKASLYPSLNSISTYTDYTNQTYTIIHSISGINTMTIANVIDVSNKIGQNITCIDSFVKGSNAKFYIKFFDNEYNAIANLNNISIFDLKESYKEGEYSYYNKYNFNNPIPITNNYAVIVSQIYSPNRTASISCKNTSQTSLPPTYYSQSGLASFTEFSWNDAIAESSANQLDEYYSLPIILYTDEVQPYVSAFSGDLDSILDKGFIQNNAIFYNKTLKLTICNINSINVDAIKITKTNKYNLLDMTDMFDITITSSQPIQISIKMKNPLNEDFSAGIYLLCLPLDYVTIYRAFDIQNIQTYPITYYLNGGYEENANPLFYTSNNLTLNLYSPKKDGYEFAGWFLDNNFTQAFNPSSLTYSPLELYAKWEFATPTIISKSQDFNGTYYNDLNVEIFIQAEHFLVNEYNTLSYQWFKRNDKQSEYTLIQNATSNCLILSNVNDSGYYVCEVSITITDPNLVDEAVTKTLSINEFNEIFVNIKPYIYDTSSVKWSYTSPLAYDGKVHTVQLLNLPQGVTAIYSNNEYSEIGKYTAHAELIFDDMSGNATILPIDDLNWEIRKAKLTIKVNNINSYTHLSTEQINSLYSFEIESEYFPEDIISLQDKAEYLDIEYVLLDTSFENIKTISIQVNNPLDIYEINIIPGVYKIVINNLSSNGVTSTNSNGFAIDCEFIATQIDIDNLNEDIKELVNNQHLIINKIYNLSYSYLEDTDVYTITIPIDRNELYNNIKVYMLEDNKLTQIDSLNIDLNGITFNSSEKNATFIIASDDKSYTSNTELIVIISITSIFLILYVCIIVYYIKRKKY